MLKQKSKTPTFISRGLLLAVSLAVLVVGITPFFVRQKTVLAATNGTINFQARLLTAAGSVVPDGVYNVEFKLYAAASGGTALWTETRTDANKVTVKNGYLTVNLGSVTTFGTGINWDQELWLTMNIGGTGSPSWDGEMNPRLKLTSVPYAFRSGAVVSGNGSVVLTVDESDVSGKICVQNSLNCGFVQGDATDFIQNTTSPQTANINITSSLGTSTALTVQGASNASVPVAIIKGGATPGSAADILQLQNSAGATMFKVDNDGDATVARSLFIDYASGVTNQLNIQGPSGQFVTVNSANNKFHIGDQADCSGRFCVAQNGSGTGGASYTNSYNSSIFNYSTASTVINQDIKITDTSSSVNHLIRGIRIDSGASTNSSATLNSFQIIIPSTSTVGSFGGNAIQVQNGVDGSATNIFRITNTGQATFQSMNNTNTAFRILNSSGTAMFTLNTNGTDNGIYVAGSGTNGAGGRIFFGATGNSGVWVGEDGTTDTNILALNGSSGLKMLVGGQTVAEFTSSGTASIASKVTITGTSAGSALTVKSHGSAGNNDVMFELQNQNGTSILNMYNAGTLAVGSVGNTGMLSISNGNYFGQIRSTLLNDTRTFDLPNEPGTFCLQGKTSCGFILNDATFDGTVRTLTLGGTGLIDFDTPKAGTTNVKTKISIPAFDPGAFNQVVAMGVAAGANVDARVLSLFDGRVSSTGTPGVTEQPHQPTLAVFSPDENNIIGFSWEGLNAKSFLKTTGTVPIGIRAGTTDIATFSTTSVDLLQHASTAAGKNFTVGAGGTLRASAIDAGASGQQIEIGGTNALGINLNQNTAVASGKIFTVNGTLRASTIDAAAGGQQIEIGGTNALGINLNENTAITGTGNSNALTVSNGTTTGNIAAFRDNTTDVVTIADGGAFALKNSTNSSFAFTIRTAGDEALMRVDTSQRKIAIGDYTSSDINAQLEILPIHDTRIGLAIKGTAAYVGRYIQVQDSAGSDIFFLQADGNVQTASGVFMSRSQSAASTNSSSASFKSGDVSGANSTSGDATFKSGNSTTSGDTGSVALMTGNATSGNSGSISIDVGTASGTTGTIYIGTTSASTVAIGNSTKNSNISMDSGTGSIMIGTGAQARSINIGIGAAAQTVVLGSQNTTSTTTVNSGTGGTTVNTTGGFTANTGTSGATFKSANSATAFRVLNASDVPLFAIDSSTDRVYIGNPNADAIGALLVLDTKNTSGDPTGVAGGMYYNSVLDRMRCYEMGRWTDCTSSNLGYDIVDYTDEFMTGSNSSGTIGALGWTGTSNVPVAKNGEANHPGLLTLSSTSTLGTIGRIVLANTNAGGTPGNPSSVFGDANYVAAIIRPLSGTAGMHVRVGLTANHGTTAEDAQGIYWSFNSGSSANWRTVTRNSGNITVNTTSTAYNTGTWYKLEIRKNASGNWEFYLNGTLQFTHSSNLPSDGSGAYPFIAIENADGMPGKTIDIDWFRYQTKILAR